MRQAIIQDDNASAALLTLSADTQQWGQLYLASLEESGLLLPDGAIGPIRQDPLIVSLMATLSAGILAGPAGEEILANDTSTGTSSGNGPDLTAELSANSAASGSLDFMAEASSSRMLA